jgi:hypothetical protein
MPSATAIPGSNTTRAQLRLIVLGQWVRAGLALVRDARAGRGLVGSAVALWQVVQAVRLALILIQRLSELRAALSRAGLPAGPVGSAAPGAGPAATAEPWSNEPPGAAAWLGLALTDIRQTIRAALGRWPACRDRRRPDAPARPATTPVSPRARRPRTPPRNRPPDRPRGPPRWRSAGAVYA